MEARLTGLSCDTPVLSNEGARDAIPLPSPLDADPPQSRLLAGIDRYLRAAGAADPALRGRLAAATARDLLARGVVADLTWAEIVAAADRSLADEFSLDGRTLPRGRVALGLATAAAVSGPDFSGRDWGTPPRQPRAMRPEDLSRWRPSAHWLLHIRLSRPAQGLAACLCWLAVLFVP